MIEALFNFIIKLIFWLFGVLGSIIIYPVQVLIVSLIPSLGDFLVTIQNWLTTSIFPMLSFCKEAILDITCCPRPLFSILITFILARWAIAPAIRGIKLMINLWKLAKGGKTS